MKPMKKYLFIDRDGTLIHEPKDTFQIDSLDKLSFTKGVFNALHQFCQYTDYELIIVSNQDGLGTAAYPMKDFELVENKMQEAFKNEGITFLDLLYDDSFEKDKSPKRKPGTAMLTKYLDDGFDKEKSFVIGDRLTDMQLAKNMGIKGIFFNSDSCDQNSKQHIIFQSTDWNEIYNFVTRLDRQVVIERNTKETQIKLKLNLDGNGEHQINTGMPFLDHMISQIATHALMDIDLNCNGDLEVDEHHSMEDIAICLGDAFKKALSDKKGIQRYGFSLPMDDCEAKVLIDFGGRPYFKWNVKFTNPSIGNIASEMFEHFFKSFSDAAQCNLHIKAKGKNHHHKIEAIFKAFARSIRQAKFRTFTNEIPSSKGIL